MNKKTSSKQLMYSVICFIISSSLLTNHLYTFAKNEAWIGIVLGFFASLPVIWIYSSLSKKFPAMSLIEINDEVFGKIIGKLISALYILFFLTLACFNTKSMGDFVNIALLPSTPIMIITIGFVLLCSFAVRKGVRIITGFSFIFVFISLADILLNSLLLIKDIKLQNLFPIFSLPLQNYVMETHTASMVPLCEILVFLMFTPTLEFPREIGKSLFRGVSFGAAVILFILLRDISILGSFTLTFINPSFMSVRYIDIAEILTRMELFYAVNLTVLLFYKVSILYYAVVSGINRLMKLKSHNTIVAIIGAFIIVYANSLFATNYDVSEWSSAGGPAYFATLFLFILPGLTLLLAAVRQKMGEVVTQ